jgi:hypothetical protein
MKEGRKEGLCKERKEGLFRRKKGLYEGRKEGLYEGRRLKRVSEGREKCCAKNVIGCDVLGIYDVVVKDDRTDGAR